LKPAGETFGIIAATSVLGGALLNQYGVGDITSLVDNLAFIESVENITQATGGADDESDDHYRERLYLAPDGWSSAGPDGAYKFHAMSAHKDILDVEVLAPVLPASVKIDGVKYTENNSIIDINGIEATVDYHNQKITFSTPVLVNEVTIPSANIVEVYVLLPDNADEETILNLVKKVLNKEEIRPNTDLVIVYLAKRENFALNNIKIVARKGAPQDLEQRVKMVLQAYFIQLRSKLKRGVIPSEITKLIQDIDGVYSVDLPKGFRYRPAALDKVYVGTVGAILITEGVV
jgi:phage-related baseplate assembly protein